MPDLPAAGRRARSARSCTSSRRTGGAVARDPRRDRRAQENAPHAAPARPGDLDRAGRTRSTRRTIAPALYLATANSPRRRVAEFTLAVFVVYLAGGALIALGPGQLRPRCPTPRPRHLRHVAEIVAGAMLIVAAVLVWRNRERIVAPRAASARRRTVERAPRGDDHRGRAADGVPVLRRDRRRSSARARLRPRARTAPDLQRCFVAAAARDPRDPDGGRTRAPSVSWLPGATFLERRWPAHPRRSWSLLVGVVAVLLGVTGLAAQATGRVGGFVGHLRRSAPPAPAGTGAACSAGRAGFAGAAHHPAHPCDPALVVGRPRRAMYSPTSRVRQDQEALLADRRRRPPRRRRRARAARLRAAPRAPTVSSSAPSSIGVRTPSGQRHETLMPASP